MLIAYPLKIQKSLIFLNNVKKYQSQIIIITPSKNEHKMPIYDMNQLLALRAKLVEEGNKLGSLKNMQGAHGTIDKQMHLYGTALGWGLLPDANAQYISYYSKDDVAKSSNCSVATFTVHCPKDSKNLLFVEDNWDLLLRAYEPKLKEMEQYTMPTPKLLVE